MLLMRLSFVRAVAFQSTTKFLLGSRWFLDSLEFLTDKFGNLSLQGSELSEVTGSGTDYFPPAPVRVGLVNEAQLEHGLDLLGETEMDSVGDKVDHALAVLAVVTDPIYPSSLDTNSEYDGKVYMVGQGDQLPEKTTEEIQWEVEEEIA
jgi:hypothetical protein